MNRGEIMDLIQIIKAIRDWCKNKFQQKGDYALTSSIPAATSQLVNDSGFITSEAVQELNEKIDEVSDNLTASDGTTFRYGVTEDGKPGYIITDEEGADTVFPFNSGGTDSGINCVSLYTSATGSTNAAMTYRSYGSDYAYTSGSIGYGTAMSNVIINNIVKLSYGNQYWSATALTDLYANGTLYTAGKVINTWFYQNAVNFLIIAA